MRATRLRGQHHAVGYHFSGSGTGGGGACGQVASAVAREPAVRGRAACSCRKLGAARAAAPVLGLSSTSAPKAEDSCVVPLPLKKRGQAVDFCGSSNATAATKSGPHATARSRRCGAEAGMAAATGHDAQRAAGRVARRTMGSARRFCRRSRVPVQLQVAIGRREMSPAGGASCAAVFSAPIRADSPPAPQHALAQSRAATRPQAAASGSGRSVHARTPPIANAQQSG